MPDPFSQEGRTPQMGELYQEHLALGASFAEHAVPLSYANETPAADCDAYVSDLSHAQVLLFSGEAAPNFAHTAFAGPEPKVGACSFQAVLTGDGSLTDVALLARTGASEYVVVSDSPRREVLSAWLSFLADISQDGVSPFADMQTQDVSGSHVLLLVGGSKAASVLSDYTARKNLPEPGHVTTCMLDNIPCIVCCLPGERRYLLFVPPHRARALWRSLLSFAEMNPCGHSGVSSMLDAAYPWRRWLAQADVIRPGAHELQKHGLLRTSRDYVGARGLFEN